MDIKEVLNDHGYVIIPDVLTPQESEMFRNQIWQGITDITCGNFRISDKTTWSAYQNIAPLNEALLQRYVGHLQPVWDIRQHETVCKTFGTVWDTNPEDLLVSFDRVNLSLSTSPPAQCQCQSQFQDSTPRMHCIQGMLYLYDVSTLISTTIQEGSLLLWDSSVHPNGFESTVKTPSTTTTTTDYIGMSVNICMTPRSLCTPDNIKKRIKAFENLRLWTHKSMYMNTKTPALHGAYPGIALPQCYRPPSHNLQLTQLGRRLIGYDN